MAVVVGEDEEEGLVVVQRADLEVEEVDGFGGEFGVDERFVSPVDRLDADLERLPTEQGPF